MEVNGIIQSVSVRNFFCHENMKIDLNKNINFVVGRNGSGKSAILTALVVGLGARANATNRGTSLKSFVKQGANSATIEIKIKNDAQNAYKHDLYGDIITIIRVINASGGTSYKLKNEKGVIVSTKYEDVAAICSIHDIQVDNPVCVLNQDDARNFHAADSKKKYSLFKRATALDLIESNYVKTNNNYNKAKEKLDRRREACEHIRKELDKLKSQYEKLKSRDETKEKLNSLQNEFYWSEIAELEAQAKSYTEQLKKHEDRYNHFASKLGKLREKCDEVKKSIDDIKTQMKEPASAERKSEFEGCVSKYQNAKSNWKVIVQQLQKKSEQIDKENSNINELSREIRQAMNLSSTDNVESLQAKKAKLNEELSECIARENTTKNDFYQIGNAMSHEQSRYENLLQERKNEQITLKRITSQLNELNVKGQNQLAIYGHKMIELDRRVNEAHKKGVFSAKPRGPIGYYLKVKDKKWTSALEHLLGNTVMSFCVNTDKDSRLLFDIMKQVYGNDPKPTITTSKFFDKIHNVSKAAVHAPQGYFSALDCFQMDDPVIANYLIDNLGLECILLVPGQEEAISLTADINNVPRNCSKVVTLDSSEFYPMPNYRTYGGRNRPSKFLQVNMTERKRQLHEEIKKTEIKVNNIDKEVKNVANARSKLSSQEKELDTLLKKYMNKIQNIRRELSDIENNIKSAEAGHVKVLTEELNLAKEKVVFLRAEKEKIAEDESVSKLAVGKAEEELIRLRKKKAQHEENIIKLHDKMSQVEQERDWLQSEMATLTNTIKNEERKSKECSDKLKTKTDIIEEKIEIALNLCDRIESPRDKEVVLSELKHTEDILTSLQNAGPTKEEVATSLFEKEEKYASTLRQIEDLSIVVGVVKKMIKKRLRYMHEIKTRVTRQILTSFESALHLRGYSGSMEINHEEGFLDLRCFGRDNSTTRIASTTNSLSGGERSYATVAFIMALWECMELPFYFMDEFDVFMDNVNRKITMDLLINHAKENLNRQFVFLTPQDTSTLESSSIMTIHKLADPVRRNQ